MTGSLAIATAQSALYPHGLSHGELAADVIKMLEDDGSGEFATDDGKRVLVRGGTVEVIPADPRRL